MAHEGMVMPEGCKAPFSSLCRSHYHEYTRVGAGRSGQWGCTFCKALIKPQRDDNAGALDQGDKRRLEAVRHYSRDPSLDEVDTPPRGMPPST